MSPLIENMVTKDEHIMIKKEKQTAKATRFSLHLPSKESQKLTELTQTLDMSKSKVIRKLLMGRADIILCNAPEVLRKLDGIGHQLAAADRKISSIVSQIEHNAATDTRDNHASIDQKETVNSLITQSDELRGNMEDSFREILSLLKNMT